MSNQVYSTQLTKVNDTFLPMIENQLIGNGLNMDQYSKQCVMNALSSINTALDAKGITFSDPQLDKSNVTTILLQIASLKLNAAASPREVYFTVRNVKTGKKENNRDVYKKTIEMGVEGDGNDAILSRFGRHVKEVRQYWLVREDDHFEYPSFNGLEMTPPKWTPKGKGPVVRVVYPIIRDNDIIEYYISEREEVAKNLFAHINNGMMNETFGICANRYDATADQKKQITAKKTEYLKRAEKLGLGALDDADLLQWISPAWSEFHSRESMLIRKMRNNVVKKIPKDFGNAFVEMVHSEATDEGYTATRREISDNANTEPIDVEFEARTVSLDESETVQHQEVAQPAKSSETQTNTEDQGKPEKIAIEGLDF
ncbi:hypothetical protein [Paenibacillus sinopodophylli]|uniref:hypothetical protein n=1 Tax=Paenibacillus sinopodophylli TaxID=1837342 RepID=UPI001BB26A97|nr:hypothetical protein [Paenibacillus sinopodophylli]